MDRSCPEGTDEVERNEFKEEVKREIDVLV